MLADLRPNVVARADYARWQLAQGVSTEELLEPARRVTGAWREEHALVEVEADRRGPLVDIEDVGLREQLERNHSVLLREHGMAHLDISEIRSMNRAVTQGISRDLYDRGVAGLTFLLNLDNLLGTYTQPGSRIGGCRSCSASRSGSFPSGAGGHPAATGCNARGVFVRSTVR